MSWAWVTVVVGLVLGVALLDFLVQNTQSARIEFFSVSGRVPVSVALLAAALAGAAVVVVVGIARMVQLRRGVTVGRPTPGPLQRGRDVPNGGPPGRPTNLDRQGAADRIDRVHGT